MNLYFAPLACSLATRISLYEAGIEAQYTQVDLKEKRLANGADFLAVNPMGQVPVLEVDGLILTENSAVLQHVADRYPQAQLAPASATDRSRMRLWLGFIGTELHKAIFGPLLDAKAPDAVKSYARDRIELRFAVLEKHLSSHEFLLDTFSIADAYLASVLNWTAATNVDLKRWPAIHRYHQKMLQRPSIAKAFGEELAMYRQEQARKAQG